MKAKTKRRCDYCRKKRTTKRERLFNNEDDAYAGRNGLYRYLCRKCEREEVGHL